jgi:hypothetical protein
MNELLDIGELVQENKRQEGWKLDIFEDVLKRVHERIKSYNKVRIREMRYKIPHMLLGKPLYDVDILQNYLVHHLRDNGLLVRVLDRTLLYISWREEDINLERYINRKTIVQNRGSTVYNVPGPELRMAPHLEGEAQMLRARQSQQRALREERFERQKAVREERWARLQAIQDERAARLSD